MYFDEESINKLDKKTQRKMLLKACKFSHILGFAFLLAGCITLKDDTKIGVSIIILALALFLLGTRKLFLKGEKRKNYLTSLLVKKAILAEKAKNKELSLEEIEKIKFKYDPIYKEKVIKSVRFEADNKYEKQVNICAKQVKKLEKEKAREIRKISDKRWKKISLVRNFKYNMTEGKICVNNEIYPFSSIKGAHVNMVCYEKIETITDTTEKRKLSLSGLAGGEILFGGAGAVIGGVGLGKKKTHQKSTTNSTLMCKHIGVVVDIDGFDREIVLLDTEVDENNIRYKKFSKDSEDIVAKLLYFSKLGVPKNYTKIEDEQSVFEIDLKLEEANKKLEEAKNNKPTYQIPEKYLS